MKRWIEMLFVVFCAFFMVGCANENPSFTISFNTNGGSFIPAMVTDGNSILKLPDHPNKERHAFDGWYWDNETFNQSFTESSLLDRPIFDNLVVYAKWIEDEIIVETVKVTFDSQGGTEIEDQQVEKGHKLSRPTVSKEGYTFDGWYTSLDQGVTLDDIWSFSTSIVNDSITLYAKWTINQYSITFHCNGGSTIDPMILDYQTAITEPSAPTKEGNMFAGWYLDVLFNQAYTFSKMPAQNLNLYAKWTANNYTLTFNSNGGSVVSAITQAFGSVVASPANPTKAGYTFAGWYSDAALTAAYTFSTMPSSNLTLYAKWTANNYTLTFNSNGGSVVSAITQAFGSVVASPANPTKAGYTFAGWYSDAALAAAYTFSTMPSNDLTLYAKWTINQYSITFISNGGTLIDSIVQDYQTNIDEPVEPAREGYTFEGWYLDNLLTISYAFNQMLSADLTLYAKWEAISYNLTYILDGGINHLENKDSYTIETPTFILKTPTKANYTFLGWYDSVDFLGNPLTEIKTGTTGNVTLYAKWSINSYRIDYYIYQAQDSLDGLILNPNETIEDVALGGMHSALLTSTGRMFTWGDNSKGQLGIGTTITASKSTPTEITSKFNLSLGEQIEHISLGTKHSAALTSLGRFFIWGDSYYGQLGSLITTYVENPTEITSLFHLVKDEKINYISLGANQSSATTTLGSVFVWGANNFGQLGDGTVAERNRPQDITRHFNLSEGETIESISFGVYHSSAISSLGRLFTWGRNDSGQLGDRSNLSKYIPFELKNGISLRSGEMIKNISLGSAHSIAVTTLGYVFSWGDNTYGQIGDGTTLQKNFPNSISNRFNLGSGEKIENISSGSSHTLALSTKGRIFTWGSNSYGQIGNGTTANQSAPVEITSRFNLSLGEKIIHISSGNVCSSAITSLGRIFTWGSNTNGQLGDGTTIQRTTPTELNTLSSTFMHQDNYDYASTINAYIPTLAGNTFSGWFKDIYLTQPYTFATMPAEDIRLYGKWEPTP